MERHSCNCLLSFCVPRSVPDCSQDHFLTIQQITPLQVGPVAGLSGSQGEGPPRTPKSGPRGHKELPRSIQSSPRGTQDLQGASKSSPQLLQADNSPTNDHHQQRTKNKQQATCRNKVRCGGMIACKGAAYQSRWGTSLNVESSPERERFNIQ